MEQEIIQLIEPATSISISSNIIWYIFMGSAIFFTALGLILIYHWIRYGFRALNTTFLIILYSSVSVGLMLIAASAAGYRTLII